MTNSDTNSNNQVLTNITKDSLHPDPIEQTKQWLNDSINANIHNPNAATLATVDTEGQPSSRIILIKEITNIIGKNTKQSMQSGFYWGYVSLINGIINKLISENKFKPKIILTGGLANTFKKQISYKYFSF